jgi:hypothetical protein
LLLLQGFAALSSAILQVESNRAVKIRFLDLTMDGDSSHRTLFAANGPLPLSNLKIIDVQFE